MFTFDDTTYLFTSWAILHRGGRRDVNLTRVVRFGTQRWALGTRKRPRRTFGDN